jgi:hypothetical protein
VSVDFCAEFDLGADFEGAEWLRARLAEEPPAIRSIVDRYSLRWRPIAWTIENCRSAPAFPEIIGPGGFSLTLSPRVGRLYHVMRFSTFASDDDGRTLLRRGCSVIATLLGSSRALLMPELTPTGFFDGLDLSAIEARLRSEIGPPAETWPDLARADHFGPQSWYVDRFDDLRA